MDTLSDMLMRIKNATSAGKETAVVPHSKYKYAIAQVLLKEGYIAGVTRKGRGIKKFIEIHLAYEGKKPKIKGIKRVSKASRRLYTNARNIKLIRQGYGNLILSTPKGILTGKEARKEWIGGEALFEIW